MHEYSARHCIAMIMDATATLRDITGAGGPTKDQALVAIQSIEYWHKRLMIAMDKIDPV